MFYFYRIFDQLAVVPLVKQLKDRS